MTTAELGCRLVAAVLLRQQAIKELAGLLHTWLLPRPSTIRQSLLGVVAHASWMWHCDLLRGSRRQLSGPSEAAGAPRCHI